MREIPLTKGYVTQLDDKNYERIAQRKWFALETKNRVYAVRSVWATHSTIYMHREIMNAASGEEIDHREGIGLDNQEHNLRRGTHQQNLANMGPRKDNTSGRKGVTITPLGRCAARIQFNGRTLYIGTYDDIDLAASKYLEKARELYGEFARI